MGAEKRVQVTGQDRGRAGSIECPVGEITHQFVGSTWQGRAYISLQETEGGEGAQLPQSIVDTAPEARPLQSPRPLTHTDIHPKPHGAPAAEAPEGKEWPGKSWSEQVFGSGSQHRQGRKQIPLLNWIGSVTLPQDQGRMRTQGTQCRARLARESIWLQREGLGLLTIPGSQRQSQPCGKQRKG